MNKQGMVDVHEEASGISGGEIHHFDVHRFQDDCIIEK
jgi:hypothetical protein